MGIKLKSQGDLDKETREYEKTHKKEVEKANRDGKEGAQLPPCTNVPEMTYGCGNSIPVRENVPEAAHLACYWLSNQTQSPLGLLPKGKTTSWCFQSPRRGLAVGSLPSTRSRDNPMSSSSIDRRSASFRLKRSSRLPFGASPLLQPSILLPVRSEYSR